MQLVSLALRDHPDPRRLIEHLSGGNRAIGEYLAENVLASLDQRTLDLLLATSITEKICGSLARVLTSGHEGQAALEDIESRDLFLRRLDEEGEWFRYHHLFAEFLQHRLERDDPDRIIELHRKAGRWFADRHLLSQAVDHYLLAGDEDDAVTLVENAAMDLLEQSQMGTLLGLAAKLPAKGTTNQPRLQVALAWAHALLHHPRDAEQFLSVAETALAAAMTKRLWICASRRGSSTPRSPCSTTRSMGTTRPSRGAWPGRTHCDHGSCAEQRTSRPSTRSTGSISTTPADGRNGHFPFHQRSTGPFSVICGYCMAGIAAREQLDPPAAEASVRHAMALAAEAEEGLGYGARLTAALLGDLLYEQGHLSEADQLFDRSHTLGAEGGAVDFMLATYGTGARLKHLLGQKDAAKARLDEGARLAGQLGLPRLAARIANERVHAGIGHVASGAPVLDPGSRQQRDRNNWIAVIAFEMEEDSAIRVALTAQTDEQNLAPVYERAHALVESIDRRVRARAFLNVALLQVEVLATMGQEDAGGGALPSVVVFAGHANSQPITGNPAYQEWSYCSVLCAPMPTRGTQPRQDSLTATYLT